MNPIQTQREKRTFEGEAVAAFQVAEFLNVDRAQIAFELDGVSVDIHQGEFVAVMGPSGSGKSTLLYALSGMDAVDSGRSTAW